MKIPEIILVVIFVIGLIFKLMMWPFSGPILVLSLGSLSALYLFLSWLIFKPKDGSDHKTGTSVITGILFMFALWGALCKLMFWPAPVPPMMLATIGLIPVLISLSMSSKNTNMKTYQRLMSIRIAVILCITIILMSVPNKQLYALTHRDDPKRIELYNRMNDNPTNEQYAQDFYEYRNK